MNPTDISIISRALGTIKAQSCAVVGGGIIGLSVAEGLSRQGIRVALFDSQEPLAASPAAAAQICLKSQRYGREPHFELQCKARQLLLPWWQSLEQEAQKSLLYRQGEALHTFATTEACMQQLRRVTQPLEDLIQRGLPPQQITQVSDRSLAYGEEVWVDARGLLDLLHCVLKGRGVLFYDEPFENPSPFDSVFVCAGAWSPQVCAKLGVQMPHQDSVQLTLGSTFIAPLQSSLSPFFLQENSYGKALKAMISPTASSQFCQVSSTTWKCPYPYESASFAGLQEGNASFWQHITSQKRFPLPFDPSTNPVEVRSGLRLGWGNRFLHVLNSHSIPLILCTGVHKSGYALAPWYAHFFAQVRFLE